MRQVGSVLQFVGGKIGGLAASAVIFGAFTVAVGTTPGLVAAALFTDPPKWVPWINPALVILGLFIIWISLRFNIWSQRQQAIDSLAEDISWAIAELVNRNVEQQTVEQFRTDFNEWCKKVSSKLGNRAFFTRADQLHFDRLGYLQPINMASIPAADHVHSMLKLKLERLRDIINWTQERRR